MKIWRVEDDASIRDIALYTLQQTGFDAQGFRDGAQLWEALGRERTDLLLLDIMLPGEDGGILAINLAAQGIFHTDGSCVGRDFLTIERSYDVSQALKTGVDQSHSKDSGGTGLGLSIVKHAALRRHACLQLQSKEGEGTQITVAFPKK